MQRRAFDQDGYRYGFNTQEKAPEVGEGHYTAPFWEYDARTARRWNRDPRPNVSISEYAAFAGNPVAFSDHLGDTIFLDKFSLSIFKKKNISLYWEDGKLYHREGGEEYRGKLGRTQENILNDLNKINSGPVGRSRLLDLAYSTNHFTIVQDRYAATFARSSNSRASAWLKELDKLDETDLPPSIKKQQIANDQLLLDRLIQGEPWPSYYNGSGGTISYNSYGVTEKLRSQLGEQADDVPSYITLAQELGHAIRANMGMTDMTNAYPDEKFPGGAKIELDEYHAAHFENIVRAESGNPLREYYSKFSNKEYLRFIEKGTKLGAKGSPYAGYDYGRHEVKK